MSHVSISHDLLAGNARLSPLHARGGRSLHRENSREALPVHIARPKPLDTPFAMFFFRSHQSKDSAMLDDDSLPFKVVRTNGHDEIVARANSLIVGRAAYETARRLYPNERVDYRNGAQIIACSDQEA
jgi:hypothetical protein